MIYERIKELRKTRKITQAELAGLLCISQRTYSRYENGEHSIPIEILAELAEFHQTSIDYLVGRTDQKEAYPRAARRQTSQKIPSKISKTP